MSLEEEKEDRYTRAGHVATGTEAEVKQLELPELPRTADHHEKLQEPSKDSSPEASGGTLPH